jgi:rRNA biogenesis protein RRP5
MTASHLKKCIAKRAHLSLFCAQGTVDWFHLDNLFPLPSALGGVYAPGAKCKARVLFVDAATKRVGLSLRRPLVDLAPPPPLPPVGAQAPGATVRRVDAAIGLLLALPAGEGEEGGGAPSAAYVHISNVSDARVERLEKKFKRGQEVDARVIGCVMWRRALIRCSAHSPSCHHVLTRVFPHRHLRSIRHRLMDGVCIASLKPSVLRAAFFSYADVAPGAFCDATIESLDERGATLSLGAGLRARASLAHLSDTGSSRAAAKLRPGGAVRGRVLSVDVAKKRVTLTLKPALLGSKYAALAAPALATPGTLAHGTVTGVKPYGVFVSFFGDMKGLAHVSKLGLEGGQTPSDAFAEGQVVKCTVLGAATGKRGFVLDLALGRSRAAAATADAAAAAMEADAGATYEVLSEVPSSVVTRVVPSGRRGVEVSLPNGAVAFMEHSHLSDHAGASATLLDLLPVGHALGPLLVLARAPGGKLTLSRKPALRAAAAAGELPRDATSVSVGALVPGYVANVTPAGVFVRFGDRLTGLAPLFQLADTFVTAPGSLFTIGQTVMAKVLSVDAAAGRVGLSLKPSACRPGGAPALRGLFSTLREIDALAAAAHEDTVAWADAYPFGREVSATVSEVKDYGTLLDVSDDDDVVGFVVTAQAATVGAPGPGAPVRGRVLDVNRKDGIVDVGVRPQLLAAAAAVKAKKTKSLKPGAAVTGEVELVKGEYVVVSLPAHGGVIGFLQVHEYNARAAGPLDGAFAVGQALPLLVRELPSEETDGRLLLVRQPVRAYWPAACCIAWHGCAVRVLCCACVA